MLRSLALAVSFLLVPAWAQEAPQQQQQMQRVESALNRLTQEQQSVYQQFQMVQELRRNEERLALQRLPLSGTGAAIRNYDEVQREDEARVQRRSELQLESDRLYARYRELEEQKRPLLDTLSALAQQRSEQPAAALPAQGQGLPVPPRMSGDLRAPAPPAVSWPTAPAAPAPIR